VPEVPDAQAFTVDATETAEEFPAALSARPATRGIAEPGPNDPAEPGPSDPVSPEALAQTARAEQRSLQRQGGDQLSRLERVRRQLAPRSFWPDRSR